MVNGHVVYTRQARKDAGGLTSSGLKPQAAAEPLSGSNSIPMPILPPKDAPDSLTTF